MVPGLGWDPQVAQYTFDGVEINRSTPHGSIFSHSQVDWYLSNGNISHQAMGYLPPTHLLAASHCQSFGGRRRNQAAYRVHRNVKDPWHCCYKNWSILEAIAYGRHENETLEALPQEGCDWIWWPETLRKSEHHIPPPALLRPRLLHPRHLHLPSLHLPNPPLPGNTMAYGCIWGYMGYVPIIGVVICITSWLACFRGQKQPSTEAQTSTAGLSPRSRRSCSSIILCLRDLRLAWASDADFGKIRQVIDIWYGKSSIDLLISHTHSTSCL